MLSPCSACYSIGLKVSFQHLALRDTFALRVLFRMLLFTGPFLLMPVQICFALGARNCTSIGLHLTGDSRVVYLDMYVCMYRCRCISRRDLQGGKIWGYFVVLKYEFCLRRVRQHSPMCLPPAQSLLLVGVACLIPCGPSPNRMQTIQKHTVHLPGFFANHAKLAVISKTPGVSACHNLGQFGLNSIKTLFISSCVQVYGS